MEWSRVLVLIFLSTFSISLFGQTNRYMVFFKDKEGTPYTVNEPLEFLSQKAIERRIKSNFSITDADLPIAPAYVQGVRDTGAEIYFPTRWMNGLLVQCDTDIASTIQGLSYVQSVEMVAPNASLAPGGRKATPHKNKAPKAEATDNQLSMLGIDKMHADGFRGEGVTIAIFDAGFSGVDTAEPFGHLYESGKINTTLSQDFVYNSQTVYQYDDHGTEVFSTIAALEPNVFTGGAPEASFQLYVTEEIPTEYRVEEYNWLFAAERADSAGVDIIHSSLGYNDFDGTNFDYTKAQMDGATAVVSRAAQMAADRGIVIVVSAGNEGNVSWKIITAPADVKDLLAVGNVNSEGVRANSSSTGPTSDNRIKPDVVAMGVNTSVIESGGSVGKSSGTSLAAPLVTGLAAGVLQRYPQATNIAVMDAIRNSGTQAASPDYLMGFGIPSYELIVKYMERTVNPDFFAVFPNPTFIDSIEIKPLFPEDVQSCTIEFISVDGKSVFNTEAGFSNQNRSYTKSLAPFASGSYFVRINWNARTFLYRFIKAK